jgi:crotonobetainyl-CoA:carnitine CoA-transferase CaiB-like acyl-CoA transferase
MEKDHGDDEQQKKKSARRAVEKPRGGKVKKPTFPPRLEIPQKARDYHFPTAPTATGD